MRSASAARATYLAVRLIGQTTERVGFDLDRGHPTLVSMFYDSCPRGLPDADHQPAGVRIASASQSRLRVLLVIFAAARDTTQKLESRLAACHRSDALDLCRRAEGCAQDRGTARIPLPSPAGWQLHCSSRYSIEGRALATTTTLVDHSKFQGKLRVATAADAF
jgi:hypothetical protein